MSLQRANRKRRYRRKRVAIPLVFAAIALGWAIGFIFFVQAVTVVVETGNTETQAIVVLTGGTLRLEAGLSLLQAGAGEKLFVSGVHRGVDVAELLRVSRQSPKALDCCIVLGYTADNTRGNARETAEWMKGEKYTSMRLVTANYHMPRSLLEFRTAMPFAAIVPHPVFPSHVKLEAWWRWPGTAALLASEYNKYLLAGARTFWQSIRNLFTARTP